MDKIITYIKRGSGFGFIFLLAIAVLRTIPIMLELKSSYVDLQPKIMLIANDFLPITVKDGKIIEPANTYKKLELQLGDRNSKSTPLPVVLDTREETSVVPNEKEGLFVMTDMIYFISDKRIQKYNLQDGIMDKEKFEKALETTSGLVSLLMVVFWVVIFSINGIIKTLLAAIIGLFALRLMKKENVFGFKSLTRLSSLLISLSMLFYDYYLISLVLVPVVVVLFLYKEDMSK